ncbi:XRE family transcriptional regulator [Cellulosimicrobium cellulans]|uniref:HTH cro/C1-type domain-containing protein n=1 Tax=Cellulosimicrobium cellulans TaxID=1710 RepID=A0A4Y4E7M7_CELCE|nr:XRE family transcriptional regulator [Cellulosimicrobium cellulans]GED11508.1 hypothetical protein CCE02nite_35070 [Cellulosimicrobium cellulans]
MDTAALIHTARRRANLSQSELARRAGTSQAAVSRYEAGDSPTVATLERLLGAAGARLHADLKDAPSLDVRGNRYAQVRRHRAAVRAAARRHGSSRIQLFGSVVRGEDGPDSDIDFLVDIDPREVGLMPMVRLSRELETILGEKVDLASRHVLAEHVAARALTEAIDV